MRVPVVVAGLTLAAFAPRTAAAAAQICRPGTVADLRGVADASVRHAIQIATGAYKATEAGESIDDVKCDAILALRALEVPTAVTSLRGIGLLANLERLSVGERLDHYGRKPDPQPLPAPALAGLAELHTLRALSLGPVAELGPVAALGTLEELTVDRVVSPDLSPLHALTHLRAVQIERGGAIADLGPVAGLKGLEVLEITGAQIVDVSPLAGLSSLRVLKLGKNPIVDGAPLAALPALRELWLDTTKVADARPFAAMTSLKTLYMCFSPATEKSTPANRAVFRALRKRGVSAPEFRGCHCC